jgi:hypothetical protein
MTGYRWGSGNGGGKAYIKHNTESGTGWTHHGAGITTPIPIGAAVIVDWLAAKDGPVRWNPLDTSMLTPLGHAVPATAPDGYVDGFLVPLLFQGFATPAEFLNSGTYVGGAFFALHTIYAGAPEAELGKLPVCRIEKSEAIYNQAQAKNFYKPVLKPTGKWVDRDLRIFGPPLLDPPRPKILHGGVAAALTDATTDALFAGTENATAAARLTSAPTPPPAVAANLFADVPAPAPTAQQAVAVAAARPRPLPVP